MEILIMSFSVLAILISLPALVISIYTLVEIKAFQRSTHKVEFMPMPVPEVSNNKNKEFLEGFSPDGTEDFIL